MPSIISKSSLLVAGVVLAISGCTTTKTTTSTDQATTTASPIAKLASLAPSRSVDPELAKACANSAANKYFLPTRVINAVDSRKAADGSTQVILKVDLRDAVCTVSPSGVVKSVVDTSPKSADQIAAEAQAAKDAAAKTTAQSSTKKATQSKKASKPANSDDAAKANQ